MADREYVFRVDMNSLDGDQIGTLLLHASDPLAAQLNPPLPGDTVLVVDEEGDRWYAEVLAVDDIWLGVRIDWDSWVPALEIEAPVSSSEYEISDLYERVPTRPSSEYQALELDQRVPAGNVAI